MPPIGINKLGDRQRGKSSIKAVRDAWPPLHAAIG
jgi:hypothetical protein